MAIAEAAATVVPIASDDLDRALDTTIVKIRSSAALSQGSVCEAIEEIMKELGVGKEAFWMEGKEIGKLQVLRFLGPPGLAEQRARKLMQMQRLLSGWQRLVAADENEEEQPLYIDGDKNKQMVRAEVLTKKFGHIVEKLVGGRKVFTKRAKGKPYLERTPLAQLVPEGAEGFDVEWSLSLAGELKIDKATVVADLRKAGEDDEDASRGHREKK